MLYTRKGDLGTSGLFGTKERFPKNNPVYEALGTVDELNSLLGICRSKLKKTKTELKIASLLLRVQQCLFLIQAELAGASKTIEGRHIEELEKDIYDIEKNITVPQSFVVPGENEQSAMLDYARAVARRTERTIVNVKDKVAVSSSTLAYTNRLSSFLYALARYTARKEKEVSPSYR